MSKNIPLTIACGDYEIVRALKEGTVQPDGIELTMLTDMDSTTRHWRFLRNRDFDIGESSCSSYMVSRDQGMPFHAIPVFLHRRFRHGFIFINTSWISPCCTSRSPETREAFADKWSKALGIPVLPMDSIEKVVRDADIGVGGTTSDQIMCREAWVKPGATYCSFARREFEPAGWARMDKVIIDSWEMNMLMPDFRLSAENGLFTRDMLHGEIHEVITGKVPGRESDTERNLIHTTGLVAHDIAMCHYIYQQARDKGLGIRLPPSGTGGPSPEPSVSV